MIQIGERTIDLSDPVILIAGAAGLLLVIVLLMMLTAARRAARASEPLAGQILQLAEGLRVLNDNQHSL